MPKAPYSKPALTLDQQIQQLRARGMLIDDEDQARHYLGFINYYRLAAYWLPFEHDHATHAFKPGTRFEQVLERYVFDRELRLLLIDAIERVEVAVRTQYAYQLGHVHGAHPLLDASLFQPNRGKWTYVSNRQQLQQDVASSKETFIQHLQAKYPEPLPPIWAAVEIMTLGQLSKWYANLKYRADRNRIAHAFDLDESNLTSFLHHLAVVRNLCAHHGRVWNRELAFTFKLPAHRPAAIVNSLNPAEPKKLYNTLVMLGGLLDSISPGHQWKSRLRQLITVHRIPVTEMGFPPIWHEDPFWQIAMEQP